MKALSLAVLFASALGCAAREETPELKVKAVPESYVFLDLKAQVLDNDCVALEKKAGALIAQRKDQKNEHLRFLELAARALRDRFHWIKITCAILRDNYSEDVPKGRDRQVLNAVDNALKDAKECIDMITKELDGYRDQPPPQLPVKPQGPR